MKPTKNVLTKEQRRSFLSFLASLVGQASRDQKLRRLMLGQGWPALLELLETSFAAGVAYISATDIECDLTFCGPCKPRQKVPRKPSMSRPKRRK